MCPGVDAVCTVMAHCVHRVNSGLTSRGGGVLMDQGALVPAGALLKADIVGLGQTLADRAFRRAE